MLSTEAFGNELKKNGFEFYSGVPCSFLKDLINYAINDCEYVMAANEGDAVATAAGGSLAGKKSVVLMQNSGLTNATSPLTSLTYTFQLPVLGFVSLRGEAGISDEPQHELMGQITEKMLELMKVEWQYLSNDIEEAKKQVEYANEVIEKNKTFFFVVKKGTFDKVALKEQSLKQPNKTSIKRSSIENTLPKRVEALSAISGFKDSSTILLASTGKAGRELYEVEDTEHNLYMVGSMGCITPFALGVALNKQDKNVIAIDGDGGSLMRLGAYATNSYYAPRNMLHILLDNNTHDSTGGQATISHHVDFLKIAESTFYENAIEVNNIDELSSAISEWKNKKGLTFLYLKIDKGSKKDLGRPKIKPFEVKSRIMEFLNG
ncbi:MAG: phosphonopyruvate decarboxylase [Oligoflexia bacterium]|nr:phosphonopyruvate decarboxylase [Oligoflexia bacterium]